MSSRFSSFSQKSVAPQPALELVLSTTSITSEYNSPLASLQLSPPSENPSTASSSLQPGSPLTLSSPPYSRRRRPSTPRVALSSFGQTVSPASPAFGVNRLPSSRPSSRPGTASSDVQILAPTATSQPSTAFVQAQHDWIPNHSTYLGFKKGQVIKVLNRDPSGWWDGELDRQRGWFPR